MITYRQIVTEVSQYLVDQEEGFEFMHWSEDEVRTYLQDALRILAMNAKHLFVSQKIVELVPGAMQTLADGCELQSVLGPVNRHGELTRLMRRASFRAAASIARPSCAASGGYAPTTFSVDTGDTGTFLVSPPVPREEKGFRVAVRCFAPPTIESLDQAYPAPADTIPLVKEFMLYYAYGQDTESVPTRDFQKTHWGNGVSLLSAYLANPALQRTMAQQPHEVPV